MAILIAGGANLTLSTSLQSAMIPEGLCLTIEIDVTATLSAAAAAEQRLDWAAAANLYPRCDVKSQLNPHCAGRPTRISGNQFGFQA